MTRIVTTSFAVLLLAAACGEQRSAPAPAASPTDTLYETTATVIEPPGDEPELCLGTVMESLPPQCEGLPLEGWDWAEVEDEEVDGGTTWGEFHVTGSYDGTTFAVAEAGPPERGAPEAPEEEDPYQTPCPEPPGGWSVVDPDRAEQEHAGKAVASVVHDPEYAGAWVDRRDGLIILNVVFTGSLERYERELRAKWGGPLCVTQRVRSNRELSAIQKEVSEEFDLQVLWSSTDEYSGTVEVGVVVFDPAEQAMLDERYGEGVVELVGRLQPVE